MTPTTMLTFEGINQPVTEWALDFGITPTVIIARLERGSTIEDAITKPMVTAPGQKIADEHFSRYIEDHYPGTFYFRGKSLTLQQWAKETGLQVRILKSRLYSLGWTLERTLTTPTRPWGQSETAATREAC